jgi:hypothetical protein
MPRLSKNTTTFTLSDSSPTVSKHTGNPYSKNTLATYKTRLNFLASNGITNPSDLAQNQDEAIKLALADTKGDSNRMRTYLSAMFYALDALPSASKTKLQCEYEKHRTFGVKKGECLIDES